MLLSSGAGSLFSRRWISDPSHAWRPLSFAIFVIIIYVSALPIILNALVGLPFLLKLLVSAVLLIPLGVAMGMPFPTGLRALADQSDDNSIEWAWAMNAASSVLGSVLAMVIAIHFGLNVTLASGALAYIVALASLRLNLSRELGTLEI
jgi:predicted MFS family arabinose efflux permease